MEKKNGRMPACQQVDKGLETCARARANICKFVLCTSAGHVLFWTLAFRKYGCCFEIAIEKRIKMMEPSDEDEDDGRKGMPPIFPFTTTEINTKSE